MSSPLLEVRRLTVSFANQVVVKGIDFEIGQGEKLALVGESGSGKTVTALSLLGLAQGASTEGQALLHLPESEPQDLMALTERSRAQQRRPISADTSILSPTLSSM